MENITNVLNDQLSFCKSLLNCDSFFPISDVVQNNTPESEKREEDH